MGVATGATEHETAQKNMKNLSHTVLLRGRWFLIAVVFCCAAACAPGASAAGTAKTTHTASHHAHAGTVQESAKAKARMARLQHSRRLASTRVAANHATSGSRASAGAAHGRAVHGATLRRASYRTRRGHYSERFTADSFSEDNTIGDVTEGEDAVVRQAAINALGGMNGTAVAIDPATGRILAMVNQKLALSSGAEPCSTIKVMVALAALEEKVVTRDTPVSLGGGYHVTLTEALAHSVNLYFEVLGRTMGFERVKHYANQFGLGELAGYNIPGEHVGVYPDEELPQKLGGVGRMCSFGESISMTPLQLGALMSAIANGGTLYYLQHPQTLLDVATFKPQVKRTLNIAPIIPEISDGMAGAVRYGTAKSLRASFNAFPVLGKTGTCSNNGTRYGWFASFSDTPSGRIVTVFFLTGGRSTFGPKAAELTGQFYQQLWDKSYFATRNAPTGMMPGGMPVSSLPAQMGTPAPTMSTPVLMETTAGSNNPGANSSGSSSSGSSILGAPATAVPASAAATSATSSGAVK